MWTLDEPPDCQQEHKCWGYFLFYLFEEDVINETSVVFCVKMWAILRKNINITF